MLMLAELLSQAGFEATFINSNHIQHRLEHSTNIATMYCRFPKFQFRSVPDGLPSDHPRSGSSIYQLLNSTRGATRTEFRNLLVNLGQKNGRWEPPMCIIADGIMSFAIDIAEELTIPIITSRTFSACCTWTYFHLTKLIEEGEVPFQGDDSRSNPFEERRNDAIQATLKDPLEVPIGLVTRLRAKRFKEAFDELLQDT